MKQMGMGPGGGTALSVEAKKKLLWGKKAEPEAVKVTSPLPAWPLVRRLCPTVSFTRKLCGGGSGGFLMHALPSCISDMEGSSRSHVQCTGLLI